MPCSANSSRAWITLRQPPGISRNPCSLPRSNLNRLSWPAGLPIAEVHPTPDTLVPAFSSGPSSWLRCLENFLHQFVRGPIVVVENPLNAAPRVHHHGPEVVRDARFRAP